MSSKPRRSAREILALLTVATASVLVTILLLELVFRLRAGALLSTEYLLPDAAGRRDVAVYDHDPRLGWVPRPNSRATGADYGWGGKRGIPGTLRNAVVTVDAQGLRTNGSPPPASERPVILVVGDSFTFGGKVSDDQTWPAELERQLGVRVLNGGVSGYGIDQTVLRAEALVPEIRPDLLIVSYIADDVDRATRSSRGKPKKPYFDVVDGELVLRNTPVPKPGRELDLFRRVLGYSFLVDALMRRIDPQYWLEGGSDRVHDRGAEVACLLMGRLAELRRRQGIPILVMAQQAVNNEPPQGAAGVLLCAADRGLDTFSLFPALTAVRDSEPARYRSLFFNHMTPAGNAFAGEVLAEEIRRRGLLSHGARSP